MRITTLSSGAGVDIQETGRVRFLLYCHDTFGLGHLRRTISLAEHFTRQMPQAEVLIVTGSPVAHAFIMPSRVDYIKLPAVVKQKDGSYRARDLSMEFSEIRDLRAVILRETAQVYRPDVFLVDHAPHGWKGEALPTLAMLRATRPDCLRVLGLRDIVDSSSIVRKNWAQEGIYHTLEHAFDLILVYGAQQLFDVSAQYALSSTVTRRLRYCGYLNRVNANGSATSQAALPQQDAPSMPADRLVVVTAGGGGDGFPLMSAYLHGLRQLPALPFASVLLTGPLMPAHEQDALRQLASSLPTGAVHIEPFLSDPLPLLKSADLVVAMAGYNTTCELLEMAQRTVIVPRTEPRQEQLIRASLLAEHGLVHMLHPADMTPATLLQSVQQALEQPAPQACQLEQAGITFNGQDMAMQAIVDEMRSYAEQSFSIPRMIAQVG